LEGQHPLAITSKLSRSESFYCKGRGVVKKKMICPHTESSWHKGIFEVCIFCPNA
jgi:hypothetical protein